MHWGHLKSILHILLGIHRNSRLVWYICGSGTPVLVSGASGGSHHNFRLEVRTPLETKRDLPIHCWSAALRFFFHPSGRRREKLVAERLVTYSITHYMYLRNILILYNIYHLCRGSNWHTNHRSTNHRRNNWVWLYSSSINIISILHNTISLILP